MRNQAAAWLPKAYSRRIAISGETAALPLITLDSVGRATPNTRALAVTESPRGSRQAFAIVRPGCGGFFIGMVRTL